MAFRCPTCKLVLPEKKGNDRKSDESRKYFPFCSERCKLVDIGAWLDGNYRIPVVSEDEEAED